MELSEKITFDGHAYSGRAIDVFHKNTGSSETLLFYEDALNKAFAPYFESSRKIITDEDKALLKDAAAIDEKIFAYIPVQVLKHDARTVLAWCRHNGFEMHDAEALEKSPYELTWNALYIRAEGTAGPDTDLKAKDNARSFITDYAKNNFGIDIENAEIPEDAIDSFLLEHPELDRFSEDGRMLAIENERTQTADTKERNMDMNEVIAKIEWTVQDIHDAFEEEFGRKPSERELENIVNSINTEGIEEVGIEKGWDSINSFMENEAHELVEDIGLAESRRFHDKIMQDFEITESQLDNIIRGLKESNAEINSQDLDEKIAFCLIEESVDMHGFSSRLDGRGNIDEDTNSNVINAKSVILGEAANGYVHGSIEFNEIQDFVDSRLKENDLYKELESKGILSDFVQKAPEQDAADEKMRVYSFEPFGYEGVLVNVDVDFRHGIPSIDILGLADGAVKEGRERMRSAMKNSGFDFQAGRTLISLSPADLKKGFGHEFAVAAAIINETNKFKGEPCLVIGELDAAGYVHPARAMRAAAEEAGKAGIKNIICHPANASEISDIDGVKLFTAEKLSDINELFIGARSFEEPAAAESRKAGIDDKEIEFASKSLENIDEEYLIGYSRQCEAIEAAVAGKHNLLFEGAPGSGKTLLIQKLVPYLTPKMTYGESRQTDRINSIAGLLKTHPAGREAAPFRMPYQGATIEGMLGGGVSCRPGEISLANNGTLFLDEAAEFRTSVLQMLRASLGRHQITLSRAGRCTTYPAKFQLVMSANPCPCGNSGTPGKICLCSKKAVDIYKKKFEPAAQWCGIKSFVFKDLSDKRKVSLEKMRERISAAYHIQRERGVFNADLAPEQLKELISFTPEMSRYIERQFPELLDETECSERNGARNRNIINAMRLSLTVANMDGRIQVTLKDLKKAVELGQSIEAQAQKLSLKIRKEHNKKIGREAR